MVSFFLPLPLHNNSRKLACVSFGVKCQYFEECGNYSEFGVIFQPVFGLFPHLVFEGPPIWTDINGL